MWDAEYFKTREEMNAWIEANSGQFQYEEVFVENGFAVEYRPRRQILDEIRSDEPVVKTPRATFQSPWNSIDDTLKTTQFRGKPFNILAGPEKFPDNAGLSPGDDDYRDLYRIEFADGQQFWAWGEEVFVQPAGCWNP